MIWRLGMFTLRLRNFWPEASSPTGFFAQLAQRAFEEPIRIVTGRESADLEVVAASPSTRSRILGRLKSKAARPKTDSRWGDHASVRPKLRRSIWFTAENLRPPAREDWSGFLSFDQESLGGRNAYLPLWLIDLRDFNADGRTTIEDLVSTRDPDLKRPGFACAFIGNPEPMRFHAVKELRSIGEVDVYGRSVGRPVTDKFSIARNYRYIMCFENDLYPGYVTEKVLDGVRSGCLPIYRGIDSASFFNPQAMMNCSSQLEFESLVCRVRELESDWTLRASMLEQPVVSRRPTIDSAISLMRRILDD